MDKWNNRVKKLALAYQTGWEYMPGDKEAGSVITDIFLDMMEQNRKRYQRIWEKQELEFLSVVPADQGKPGFLKCGLAIKATEGGNGKWLPQNSKAYVTLDDGSFLWFSTSFPLQLTTASLKCAVYEKGLSSWLTEWGENIIPLFSASGQELAHPVFRWRFFNLCNGLKQCRFKMMFPKDYGSVDGDFSDAWKITDHQYSYSLKWEDTPDGTMLCGDTPEFAGNLQDTEYEVILDLSQEEICSREKEGKPVGLEAFGRGFSLAEPAVTLEAEICLTDDVSGDGRRVLPFGHSPDAASCCYLACDGILARGSRKITLQFTESFDREEKLPPKKPKEYDKIYKKYPWLQQTEEVAEWKPRETVWEYFNGKLWRTLPESRQWNTGCAEAADEKKERCFHWSCPEDMMPCSIDGEEHFFIRLRAVDVGNSYAAYYRKDIPVLENIRFGAGETFWERVGQDIPELSKIGQEKMHLGFDHSITPGSRWYTEYGSFSFDRKQIAGWGERFGENAFWIEFTPAQLQEMLALPADAAGIELTANYVEALQIADPAGYDTDMGMQEIEILQGAAFYVETKEIGVLDAVSVADTYYNRTGAPRQAGWKTAENVLSRFGRLLTPMDIETLFEDRYPALQVLSCRFWQESGELIVEVAARNGFAEDAYDRAKLKEIQEWLEEEAHIAGSLWLKGCHVEVRLR